MTTPCDSWSTRAGERKNLSPLRTRGRVDRRVRSRRVVARRRLELVVGAGDAAVLLVHLLLHGLLVLDLLDVLLVLLDVHVLGVLLDVDVLGVLLDVDVLRVL